MNPAVRIILAAVSGMSFAALIIVIARRGVLSMRYTLGWLFVAACVVLGGLFGGVVEVIADALHVQPVEVVVAAAMAGLLGITVQLSISVSGLTEAVRTLTEANALLEARSTMAPPAQVPSISVEVEELEARGNEA